MSGIKTFDHKKIAIYHTLCKEIVFCGKDFCLLQGINESTIHKIFHIIFCNPWQRMYFVTSLNGDKDSDTLTKKLITIYYINYNTNHATLGSRPYDKQTMLLSY